LGLLAASASSAWSSALVGARGRALFGRFMRDDSARARKANALATLRW
jgi:hypothetical protein